MDVKDHKNIDRSLAKAAATKYHRLSSLNNRNVLSHSSGSWKSKIKVSTGLVPSDGCEKGSVLCLSPSFWWFTGYLWRSLVCGSITLISAFIFI